MKMSLFATAEVPEPPSYNVAVSLPTYDESLRAKQYEEVDEQQQLYGHSPSGHSAPSQVDIIRFHLWIKCLKTAVFTYVNTKQQDVTNNSSIGPTVFRGKFWQIPRRRLPNFAAHRGKFLEFRGSPRPPILEYIVPTLAQLYTYNFT